MVKRKAKISKTAASNITSIAWFIESKVMVITAERFVENIYAFIENLCKNNVSYAFCQDKKEQHLGTNVFLIKRNIQLYF